MGKTLTIRGNKYKVLRSNKTGKKFKVKVNNTYIHFGARGYSIAPGTPKGDRYCARSSGIKNSKGIDANDLSRAMWRCSGKRSMR